MENLTTNTIVIILTSITGLVGAITGLSSIWFNYLTYSRDNIRLKVKALKNMKTFLPGMGASEKSFLVINAANAGRRTVIISKAAFISLKFRGGAISADSMRRGNQELKEGQSIDYMMEEEDIDYSDVSHVSIYDSVGNEYRYYLIAWYIRFFYWFLDIIFIRRKPLQAPQKPTKKSS